MDITCKNCGSTEYTKNGKVRSVQRYKCKSCGHNFIIGDKREKVSPEGKALAVILYSTGKASYGFISKLFKVTRAAVLKWIRNIALSITEPEIDSEIKEIQIDEMWHFINEKNTKFGYGEPWIVIQKKLSDGFLAIVLLKRLKNHTTNSST